MSDNKTIMISYLKSRVTLVGLLLISTFIFMLIFYLYQLPIEATGYAGIICMAFFILFGLVDFLKFRKKHLQLVRQYEMITAGLTRLPEPKDLIEADYIKLIQTLFGEKYRIRSEFDQYEQHLREYYDLWTHQIKVPISAIKLLLDTQEHLDRAVVAGELFKIEQYVNMALYYTRLDSLDSDYRIEKLKLDQVLRQAVRKYSRLFIQKQLKLDYQNTDAIVTSDEKWLSFLIEQVISNSVKYTPNGGKITIAARPNGSNLTVVIEDTGIGISKEDIPRIFEKGYTGENGRKQTQSTGLGLYLCKRVADNLNIRLAVQSDLGKGTRVSVIFSNSYDMIE